MAKKKEEKNVVESEAVAVEVVEQKYPFETLKAHCTKIFGVTSSTFAGATADVPDGEYSIDEIRNKINKWLKKEVK